MAHARLGDTHRLPRPARDRRDPRDVLQARHPQNAHASVGRHITNDLWGGWLVRGMHRWGASVFIILMFMHMGRVFLFGAYKYPRELNWIVGVLHPGDRPVRGPHRLPAALRPDRVLGDRGRGQHQRHRPRSSRPWLARRVTRWGGDRPRDAVPLLLDPHAARARGADRPDRAPPLPRGSPRRQLAAVVEGCCRASGSTSSPSPSRPARASTQPAPRAAGVRRRPSE